VDKKIEENSVIQPFNSIQRTHQPQSRSFFLMTHPSRSNAMLGLVEVDLVPAAVVAP
jgi:hypothetical protein